jgi:hypothetical protein
VRRSKKVRSDKLGRGKHMALYTCEHKLPRDSRPPGLATEADCETHLDFANTSH